MVANHRPAPRGPVDLVLTMMQPGWMPSTGWMPGQPITDAVLVAPVLATLGMGQNDMSSFSAIGAKLASRSCLTVGDLGSFTYGEMISSLRALDLQKKPEAYISAIEVAIGKGFERAEIKKERGGDTLEECTKVRPSADFKPWKYEPDGRVYDGLPEKGTCDYLTDKQEQLYLDKLVLDAHTNPEPSMGDYLPCGMTKRLGKIHDARFPPFKPLNFGSKMAAQKSRLSNRVIADRFQNGRTGTYKRVKLDEKFVGYFGEKTARHMSHGVNFFPSTSEELEDNELNNTMEQLVKVYNGGLQVCVALPRRTALT